MKKKYEKPSLKSFGDDIKILYGECQTGDGAGGPGTSPFGTCNDGSQASPPCEIGNSAFRSGKDACTTGNGADSITPPSCDTGINPLNGSG